jgi:CO/xanthine dehydrogenase FAD-binding subunit
MSEINKDYIDLDNIKKESEKQNIKTTNNNSFFIGSTTDLQDLINPERSKKKALEHIIDVEAENDKKV